MFSKFSCTCGNQLYAWEGMATIRCAACGQTHDNPCDRAADSQGPQVGGSPAGFVVYGFNPPAGSVPQMELKYQVVQVAEERTPPVRDVVRAVNDIELPDEDDGEKTYPVSDANHEHGQKSQAEMWAAEAELRPPWMRNGPRRRRRVGSTWPLERLWVDCLLYPLRGCLFIGGLGFVLAVSSFGLLQVMRNAGTGAWLFLPIWIAALGYTSGFLTCTFRSGMCGETAVVRWPAGDILIVARSLLALLLSFLAGPVFPLVIAIYYWKNAGQLDAIDVAILMELYLVAIGWWFLAFVSLARRHRWSDVLPAMVLKRVWQFGYRCFGALGLLFAIALLHGMITLFALESPGLGGDMILMLFGAIGWLFCMTFLMRWVGICVHRQLAPDQPRKAKPRIDEREAMALDCRWIEG